MKDPMAHEIPDDFVQLWKEAVENNGKVSARGYNNIMVVKL